MCPNCGTEKAPSQEIVISHGEGVECVFLRAVCSEKLCRQPLGDIVVIKDGRIVDLGKELSDEECKKIADVVERVMDDIAKKTRLLARDAFDFVSKKAYLFSEDRLSLIRRKIYSVLATYYPL